MEEKERYEWRYNPKTMEDHMFDNLTKIKIYYENIPNLLNQYEKQIKEVEKGKQELKTYLDKAINDCNKFFEENQQLKKQLEEIKQTVSYQVMLMCQKENILLKQSQNQKAIEQLKKVKELCKSKFEWWENSEWEGNIYDKSDVSNAYFDIEANIDQQIALLKGNKDES